MGGECNRNLGIESVLCGLYSHSEGAEWSPVDQEDSPSQMKLHGGKGGGQAYSLNISRVQVV